MVCGVHLLGLTESSRNEAGYELGPSGELFSLRL